ncbi:MAG: hypothetical protein ACE5FU_05150 [Nitrospinota bacterium]
MEVVINTQVKKREISKNALRAIFGMRMHKWADGTQVKVFVLQDADQVHKEFCKEVLQVFPHQLRRSWDRLIFSGIGQAPSLVYSEEEMYEKVATTLGAIGYMKKEKIDDSVRVLVVK